MKLVLLPGMDGTGLLFKPILESLQNTLAGIDVLVLNLPNHCPQDYDYLSSFIAKQLPQTDFILVAESFSGGIAARLSSTKLSSTQQASTQLAPTQLASHHLKGIIFVASFLSSPKPYLPYLASLLPLHLLVDLPLSSFVYRTFLLGNGASKQDILLLKKAIKATSVQSLKQRLKTISKARYNGFTSDIPIVHISASQDRLVSKRKIADFTKAYPNHTLIKLEGPHFLLQTQAEQCASMFADSIDILLKSK